jgi:cell fate regulator YaaT (PSP1 superfamily)
MTFVDLPVLPSSQAVRPPSSLVVRYGHMRMMGEFAYDGDVRPGCGAKVVIRTRRGTELAEVVTTTCSNAGCAKSITRDKLLEYIENSGGADYPFSTEGRVMRIAGPDDYRKQSEVEAEKPQYVSTCKTLIREMDLPMKLVEVELLLGGEMATFFFASEERVDFRALVKHLAAKFRTRIQMHQVGARDEARLVADYETCGQHCCCKQFLKVLKPVNMNSAKMQRATFDPNKISGRCGRLKCCLRYEESTYEEMKKQLPPVGMRVRVEDGIGNVIDAMILTQLVKVRLESNDRIVAVANEEILERDVSEAKAPRPKVEERRDEGRRREARRGPRSREPQQAQEFGDFAARRANEERADAPEEPAEVPKQAALQADAGAPLPDVEEIRRMLRPSRRRRRIHRRIRRARREWG